MSAIPRPVRAAKVALLSISLFVPCVVSAQPDDAVNFTPENWTLPALTPEEAQSLDLETLLTAKISSASRQEEPIHEAPGPVTVVTSDMIRMSGARTLKEALLFFVPGFTDVEDGNEILFAMRGVYATGQQKVLIMVDGHRLNSRVFANANPDFSIGISPDKVKQIEVIRGPGSAVYGNVALTAVVNIITRDGGEHDGAIVELGGGSAMSEFNTRTVRLTGGMPFADGKGSFALWGSYYRSGGERVDIAPEDDISAYPVGGVVRLQRIENPGATDIGLKARYGDFQLLAMRRTSSYVEPFNGTGSVGQVYDYDRFRKINSAGPGQTNIWNHLRLQYNKSPTKNLSFEVQTYFDSNDFRNMSVSHPATPEAIAPDSQRLADNGVTSPVIGGLLATFFDEQAAGAIAWGQYDYKLLGTGNFMLGGQFDRFWVTDSLQIVERNFDIVRTDAQSARFLQLGRESIYSGFAQWKHRVLDGKLLVNAGLRYDFKDRRSGPNYEDFSPRLALIYDLRPATVKLSYARSFIDAPYLYRYNSIPQYQGAQLRPEHLDSIQLTPSVNLLNSRLQLTTNFYYNRLYDVVWRSTPAPGEPWYRNSGVLNTVGAELEAAAILDRVRLRTNATVQRVTSFQDFSAEGGRVFNVPTVSGRASVDFNPPGLGKNYWTNLTLQYVGPQLSPINSRFAETATDGKPYIVREFINPDNMVKSCVTANLGVHANDLLGVPGLGVDATVYNVTASRCEQGGNTTHPYPTPGRWFLASLRYVFKASPK